MATNSNVVQRLNSRAALLIDQGEHHKANCYLSCATAPLLSRLYDQRREGSDQPQCSFPTTGASSSHCWPQTHFYHDTPHQPLPPHHHHPLIGGERGEFFVVATKDEIYQEVVSQGAGSPAASSSNSHEEDDFFCHPFVFASNSMLSSEAGAWASCGAQPEHNCPHHQLDDLWQHGPQGQQVCFNNTQELDQATTTTAQQLPDVLVAPCAVLCLYNSGLSFHREWAKQWQSDGDARLLLQALQYYQQAYALLPHCALQPGDSLVMVLLALCANISHCHFELAHLPLCRVWNENLRQALHFASDRHLQNKHYQFFFLYAVLNDHRVLTARAA